MASDAVGTEAVSQVVGYKITKGNFGNSTPNLPQRIAIIGEGNTANQASIDPSTPVTITTAKQAGELFGFGSPIHMAMRILRPSNGIGVAGIPTVVYPQLEAVGATAKIYEIDVIGVATSNATHTVKIGGRSSIDGATYSYPVLIGETTGDIVAKIADVVNNALSSPCLASEDDYTATLTTKWKGLTANDVVVSIDTNGNDAGLTYSVTSTQNGTGTPDVDASLALFENTWNTIVVNTYGTQADVVSSLETFNGVPDVTNPTGRFTGTVMKPFFAFTGTTDENGETTFTDARKTQVTIAMCPAPLSDGHPLEAAANYAFLQARQSQDNPHLDISGKLLPDMPAPDSIGYMSSWVNRDAVVKLGHSTVELIGGVYSVCDFVTTYHPDGETPPQYRYVRNLTIDFNVRFKYYLLEQINVVGHAIAPNNTTVTAQKVIKPAQWVQILNKFFADLALNGLVADPEFSNESLEVNISSTNPDRFETFFKYKRTGFARIASTTAEAGFNFNN